MIEENLWRIYVERGVLHNMLVMTNQRILQLFVNLIMNGLIKQVLKTLLCQG